MVEGLFGSDPFLSVIRQHFIDQVPGFRAQVRNVPVNPSPFLGREVDLHVRSVASEVLQDPLGRRAEDIVDFVDLVKFIFAWEQREQRRDLEEDTADPPDVHFVVVVPVCQQALGGSVPAS